MTAIERPIPPCSTAAPSRPIGGCDFAADPDRDAFTLHPLWRADIAPAAVSYLTAAPQPPGPGQVRFGDKPDTRARVEAQLRIGPPLVSNTRIALILPIDDAWPTRLTAAQTLRARLLGRACPSPLTRLQMRRYRHALRVHDAIEAGAGQRDAAIALFGTARIDAEPWKTSALRKQIRDLRAHADLLIQRGWRAILAGLAPTRRPPPL